MIFSEIKARLNFAASVAEERRRRKDDCVKDSRKKVRFVAAAIEAAV